MFPTTQRTGSHPGMTHQNNYFGYYPQQTPPHYPPTDFSCNFQPIVPTSQMSDSFPSNSWYNNNLYMPPHHPSQSHSMYPQKQHPLYDNWNISSFHSDAQSGAHSPKPLLTITPSEPNSTANQQSSNTNTQLSRDSPALPNESKPSFLEFTDLKNEPMKTDSAQVNIPETPENSIKNSCDLRRLSQQKSPYHWMKKQFNHISDNSVDEETFVDIDEISMKGTQDDDTESKDGSWRIGKTRTKDKYRVVYTDHQRSELEKEFHFSRYITIRRKTEIASMLGLSERQIKIWFQNRRAKERKQLKKREDIILHDKMNPTLTFHHMQQGHIPPSNQPPPHYLHHPPVNSINYSHIGVDNSMTVKSSPYTMDIKSEIIAVD